MADKQTNWILKIVDMVTGPLKKITSQTTTANDKLVNYVKNIDKLGSSAFKFNQISQAIQGVNDVLQMVSGPGAAFEQSMAELSAITGVVGKDLENIGEKARKTALMFGGDAAAQVDSYKKILSDLGPDIAKSPVALDLMGKSVQILSKQMGGDAVGAVDALNTGLLQFRVNLDDPTQAANAMVNQMNVMSAAARAGSAEIPQISAALKVAGVAAYSSKLSFEETNAAIQVLAKGGLKGAEAGTALRNVLATMAQGRFLPKDVQQELNKAGVDIKKLSDNTIPYAQRMKELEKIQGDSALMTKLFGKENAAAAGIMLNYLPLQEQYTKEITGTNDAVDQANKLMGTHNTVMGKIGAFFKDTAISIFDATKEYIPFVAVSIQAMDVTTKLMPLYELAKTGVSGLGGKLKNSANSAIQFSKGIAASGLSALKTAGMFMFTALVGLGSFISSIITSTAAMLGFNIVMSANPIGLFILGLLALGAVVAVVISYWDEIKTFFINLGIWLWNHHPFKWLIDLIDYVFPGFKQGIIDTFNSIWEWIKGWYNKVIGAIQPFINKIKTAFGGQAIDLKLIPGGEQNSEGRERKNLFIDEPGNNNSTKTSNIDSSVSGGKGEGSRNVKMTIQKIEINLKPANIEVGMQELGPKIARAIVGAVRDAEIILSS